jgi:hypothetical protein
MNKDSTAGNGVNSDKSRAGGGDEKTKEGHFLSANFANDANWQEDETTDGH